MPLAGWTCNDNNHFLIDSYILTWKVLFLIKAPLKGRTVWSCQTIQFKRVTSEKIKSHFSIPYSQQCRVGPVWNYPLKAAFMLVLESFKSVTQLLLNLCAKTSINLLSLLLLLIIINYYPCFFFKLFTLIQKETWIYWRPQLSHTTGIQ